MGQCGVWLLCGCYSGVMQVIIDVFEARPLKLERCFETRVASYKQNDLDKWICVGQSSLTLFV